jgi:hypothetical protein
MRDRLTVLRKAFDKETKEKEATANKAVRDIFAHLSFRISIILVLRLSRLS